MEIHIIKEPISRVALSDIAKEGFGDMVKAVVDVEQGIMAFGSELHADAEVVLIEEHGASRENTWGINLYPGRTAGDWIEFDSMINIKPAYGNRSRDIEDASVREKIRRIVGELIRQ